MLHLSNTRFAFLDIETTGLSPWFGDRICQIAAIWTICNEDIIARGESSPDHIHRLAGHVIQWFDGKLINERLIRFQCMCFIVYGRK